jgi:heme/copper-type cytochrome/quinol oxidase subunit 2
MAKRRGGMLALALAIAVLALVHAAAAAVADSTPPDSVFRLVIADLKPGVETPALKAKEGDKITIVITSTRSGTLEVHGYNRRIAVTPGAEVKLTFKADYAGRFPIHLHAGDGKHIEVTALEIMPR